MGGHELDDRPASISSIKWHQKVILMEFLLGLSSLYAAVCLHPSRSSGYAQETSLILEIALVHNRY